MKKITSTLLLASSLAVSATGATAGTLDDVVAKGHVQCGVSQGLPGFSNFDDKGNWSGVDVDICRAMAAAIFNDSKAVKFTPLSSKERFTALQSGEIDVLSRNTTWTATRDTALGLNFTGVNYYDGQGFMVRKDLGVNSAKELSGAAICTQTGTTTELNVADYFRSNGMDYTVVAFEKSDEVVAAYDSGRCDVYTTDQSGLYAQRTKLKDMAAHKVLPEIISKEPLGPVVRQGDDQWLNIVKWSLFCMVNAEEMGITSANVASKKGGDPGVKRLLGEEGSFGENLGVSPTWCANIVSQVGNYGESFARNLSVDPLNISRGVNELWSKGGIQYAPPIR
ncbi:MAG: amino acid ABC transporter substrate-binding protein [Gammaproteobacteria bacterium]|nr:amino acid ABC transporter substrate-binding protein [Gammaproteobacteria bacterium]